MQIVFDLNGAPEGRITQAAQVGETIQLPDYTSYLGKELAGWTTVRNRRDTLINVGTDYTVPDAMSVTLYAAWDNCVTVRFDANGGDLEAPEGITCRNGQETITLPDYTGTREGYRFLGWTRTAEKYASVKITPYTIYSAGAEYPVPDRNTTLYAMWSVTTPEPVWFGIRLGANISYEPGNYDTSLYSDYHYKTNQILNETRWVVDVAGTGTVSGNHLVNSVTENLSVLPNQGDSRQSGYRNGLLRQHQQSPVQGSRFHFQR